MTHHEEVNPVDPSSPHPIVFIQIGVNTEACSGGMLPELPPVLADLTAGQPPERADDLYAYRLSACTSLTQATCCNVVACDAAVRLYDTVKTQSLQEYKQGATVGAHKLCIRVRVDQSGDASADLYTNWDCNGPGPSGPPPHHVALSDLPVWPIIHDE